ncbi:putative 3-hydroxyisobutyryl-CoA hydrolase 3, partial [Mucuna pruriens]
MVTGKGSTKGSTSKGKPFPESSHGEYCKYRKRPGHTKDKDTCYKLYGKEKVLERMGRSKGPTQTWVNQTTSNQENVTEHPFASQLDQDIQTFINSGRSGNNKDVAAWFSVAAFVAVIAVAWSGRNRGNHGHRGHFSVTIGFKYLHGCTIPPVFAMPETALGLFPDVGEYVGLTGARLDGAEMLACGLATHFVPSSKLSLLEEALCKVETSDSNAVSAIINKYSEQPFLKEDSVYHRLVCDINK